MTKFTWILGESRNCLYCGKEFVTERKTKKFCSLSHQKLMWKKNHRDIENRHLKLAREKGYFREYYQKNLKVEIKSRKCLTCLKEFTPDWQHNFQKYCSEKCRRKSYRPTYRINHLQHIKQKDFEYKSKIRFGTTSKTLNRKIVEKRDGKACKLCGKPKEVIHHIRYSGKPEDLVSLCRTCHARIHQQFKKEPYWKN